MKNTVDVNAYLLELYLHTEQITDPSQNPQQFNEFVAAFEHCWNRYKETSQPLNAGMVHMMLGLLNLSIHMVEQALSGHDRFQLRNRLSVIKSELIHGITLFLPKQEQLSA